MIKEEQLILAAECMNMDLDLAKQRARDMGDGHMMLASDVRGAGSVLVGPDLSTLFFASMVSPHDALQTYRSGRRTPKGKFAILWGKDVPDAAG